MSRTHRVLALVAAWMIPVIWLTVALHSGPSDGTSVSPATAMLEGDRWGQTVTVVRAFGDTPLREGDVIRTIDGRSFGDWVATGEHGQRVVGETVPYEVLRPAANLDRILVLDVTLTQYPTDAAVTAEPAPVVVAVMLLVAASLVFWRRPRDPAAAAFLAAGALVPAVLASHPFGLGAIDLAGSRGVTPHVTAEVLCTIGLGALLATAITFLGVPDWLRRRPWLSLAVVLVPLLGYAAWLLLVAGQRQDAARTQAQLTIVAPALIVTAPVVGVALVLAYRRASTREDRLAGRLVLLALGGGLAARLLLGDLPNRVTGAPLVPGGLLAVLLVPLVLGGVSAALTRYRLDEIEPTVRRALTQALVASLVGISFLALARTVNLTSDTSFGAMVAGGALALLLLPVALWLNRVVRRLLYGDREFPRRVVSELRGLDPLASPEVALQETLRLLARRLRLSYAAIEVFGETGADRVQASIGALRGRPTTIDLVAGGANLGRLELEVDPARDPFGPGDRRLLEDVGSQVGALVQAMSVNRELQRSRQHLVTAREEERRRLRNDLHDGLGPSLATLAMRLDAARDMIEDDPAGAADLVESLSEQARQEIAEVRRLVDGLRPPALDQFGLVSALRNRADEHNLAARSGHSAGSMIWTVDAEGDLEPLPAAVEVAAYRIVLEAVTNAGRHSGARACAVTLRRTPDCLRIRVRDTGTGLGPAATPGVGLSSMRERAEEVGGTWTLTSDRGSGTVVEVRLPLGASAPPVESQG